MYPPVGLNQYTLVNKTHIIYIRICLSRPRKHLKIDFTSKLSSQRDVKYGSNLMSIFFIIFSIFGGPEEAYVETRGTKVSFRPHHTADIYV